MLQGPSLELYTAIIRQTKAQLIASGGISCLQDLIALQAIGCEGAIVGKAIYEGHITLKELADLC
jgi:phosphoribosylformimino-5-aminoimidazole carboxamide ribotide isomerase